jgi:predicted transposase YbfD/YdcC
VRDLLRALAGLASAVITIDAMHTQHDTARVILGRGADYVMTVKANMPTLYKQLRKLPWAAVPAVSAVSTSHGRRARRTIRAVLAPAWIDFDGAAQVAQLRRTVTRKGRKTVEVVYLITSDRDADPATLAAWARSHWEIENRLHWVRDVTYQEDKSLVRTGNAPRVMASLRSLAISLLRLDGHANIAAANRYHARNPQPATNAKAASGCMNVTLPCPCACDALAAVIPHLPNAGGPPSVTASRNSGVRIREIIKSGPITSSANAVL